MKNNFNKAFTLVELIVVITILAVLATVAFISFQGYSTESRDTKRKTDLATISKWLQVYLAANSFVPEPSETKTTITFSGSELLTQWYAGESVLNTLRVKEAKDPVDETFYTYSTNANNTKFQLVWFLENTQTAGNFLENKLFADYSDRNIYTVGESVWVLLDDTNTPIQELWNTAVELENNTTVYKTVLNKRNIVTESGSTLKTKVLWAQKNLYGWRAFDQNCPIDDIQIWDQTWAGCNSTLGDWFEWWKQNDWSDGTIWTCYNYDGTNNPLDSDCSIWNPLMESDANPKDFFDTKQPNGKNNNQDSEFDTIWWKLYTWEQANNSACPAGWSVPSDEQWENLETYLNGWTNCRNVTDWWQCDGLWWNGHNAKTHTNNLANVLKIPLAGHRDTDGSTFSNRGDSTHLWSSTSSSTNAYRRTLHWNYSTVYRDTLSQVRGFSVRCIKD